MWRGLLAWGATATARPSVALVRRVARATAWRPHATVARAQPGFSFCLACGARARTAARLAGRAGGRPRSVLVAALLGGAFDAEVAAAPARTQAVAHAH